MSRKTRLGASCRTVVQATRRQALRSKARLLGVLGGAIVSILASAATVSSEPATLLTELGPLKFSHGEFVCQERTPFLVAAVIFGVQACTAFCCSWLVRRTSQWPNVASQGESAPDRVAVLGALMLYFVISLACFLGYLYLAIGCNKLLFVSQRGATGTPHLGLRNVLSLTTTPLQWLCFCRVCTESKPGDAAILVGSTVIMQAIGILMLLVSTLCMWSLLFLVDILALVLMFWKARQLPLLQNFEFVARPVLYTELFLLSAYPLAVAVRAFGFIGVQTEQVLVYTILDVSAKSVSLGAILMAHVHVVVRRFEAAVAIATSFRAGTSVLA